MRYETAALVLKVVFADMLRDADSRGLILDVDVAAMRVSARTEYVHPLKLSSAFEGSTQLLPDGNVVVGWGANPWCVASPQLRFRRFRLNAGYRITEHR